MSHKQDVPMGSRTASSETSRCSRAPAVGRKVAAIGVLRAFGLLWFVCLFVFRVEGEI